MEIFENGKKLIDAADCQESSFVPYPPRTTLDKVFRHTGHSQVHHHKRSTQVGLGEGRSVRVRVPQAARHRHSWGYGYCEQRANMTTTLVESCRVLCCGRVLALRTEDYCRVDP